jgi:hypothetical protein
MLGGGGEALPWPCGWLGAEVNPRRAFAASIGVCIALYGVTIYIPIKS